MIDITIHCPYCGATSDIIIRDSDYNQIDPDRIDIRWECEHCFNDFIANYPLSRFVPRDLRELGFTEYGEE